MTRLRTKLIVALLIIILSLALGIYIGLKNRSTYQIESMDFSQISDDVRVYRNERGVPTIIANNENDLFFAQGFEFARDRLWQAEFFRSLINGELARLFGDSQIGADKYLLTIGIAEAANDALAKVSDEIKNLMQSYVDGLNEFIERHENNLPIEFTLLGIKPKKWELKDAFGLQGVMSQTLSIASLNREFFRLKLGEAFGPIKANEIYPIFYKTAEDYYLNYNFSQSSPLSTGLSLNDLVIQTPSIDSIYGSNNWVVGPDKSLTGNPLIANDPHLSLDTPGIWWEVNLVSPTLHVQGFALPGVPGIILGHNEHVAWGMTNTGLDAVDVFYFKTSDDGSQYYLDGEWKDFEILEYKLGSEGSVEYKVKWTDYGPVLDPEVFPVPEDEYSYALRWTLLEDHPRDIVVKSIIDLNKATNTQEFRSALENFAVPGQNFVFATVDGDFGYQFTGIIPIRKTEGSGVLPQNGSDPNFGWMGFVDYEDQYFEINPTKGYFSTANEEVDPRETSNFTDSFYITDYYALPYRSDRIKIILEEKDNVSLENMQSLQGDTYNLYAEKVLSTVFDEINQTDYSDEISSIAQRAIDILEEWMTDEQPVNGEEVVENRYRMDRSEIGATIFAVFRMFFEEQTFKDEFEEFEEGFYSSYDGSAERGITSIIDNETSSWYDDISTTQVETREDITVRAFEKSIQYLRDNYGRRLNGWKYENLHTVVFEHPIGSTLGIFNEGGISSDGSEHTVKAAGGTPNYINGEISMRQTSGSSMRFLAEVEDTWSNVFGIAPPGASQHFLSGHRGDVVRDWVNNVLYAWDFSENRSGIPSFTYKKR